MQFQYVTINQLHKSQDAPVPYPRMFYSEQKCAHFCSESSILGYGTGAFWDLWIRSIHFLQNTQINIIIPAAELTLNSLRLRQNGCHFPDDILKCIFLDENVWISIKISFKFVPNGPINNISALVEIMAWRWPGEKPLSEPMMVSLLMHICVVRPQWVNGVKSPVASMLFTDLDITLMT